MFKRNLSQRSLEALGLFNKAIENLVEINEDILSKKASLESDRLVLEMEIKALSVISNNNTKVISNIEKILS